MLRALGIVAFETFTLLRRDKVFVPAVVASLLIAGLANLASDWSVEDFIKILYDVGFFGFTVTGSLVALFWGTKTVSDSRQEGSLEVQLAAPIGRGVWIVGKYLGLVLTLVLLGGLLLVVWQAGMLVFGYGRMTGVQLVVFAYMMLGWLVLAALALLLASVMRQALALFCALALWLGGMATALVNAAVSAEAPEFTKKIVGFLARFWDLQQFNLVDHVLDPVLLPARELAHRAAYGALLVLVLLSLASVFFSRRDVLA